ncbi:tyrosine-type recombinase/integrase [uncultured Sphingomonas sp.]|uniref:tyrosine-type recombinase/integrase n=1 Tax=uncultured Sphingomonas sp. TaxID=158754 RepID=UPI002630BA5A|nr:tyrosine-type recombinase/integrase [uncultured Sphingomonas sp.]
MIEGVHFVRKRLSGGSIRWYVYAWRGGPRIMSADGRKKPKLSEAALTLLSEAKAKRASAPPRHAGTLGALVNQWRISPEWALLKPNTRDTWGYMLNAIDRKWSKVPLAVFDDTRMIQKVVGWRDSRKNTPRAADNRITVLRALLKYGIQLGLLRINVAAGVGKLYKSGQRAEIIWTEEDLEAVRNAAEPEDWPVLDAIDFAGVTGLRREDLARVTWKKVQTFAIVTKARKESGGERQIATIPRIPQLDAILEKLADRARAPGVQTLLVTAKGVPWHLATLTREVSKIAAKAGLIHILDEDTGEAKNKHLHDIRGTFVTRLMTTTDLTDEDIADIMGWSSRRVARIRKIYVSDHVRTVALGQRIARGF